MEAEVINGRIYKAGNWPSDAEHHRSKDFKCAPYQELPSVAGKYDIEYMR